LRKKILHSSFNEKAARSFIEPIQALVTKASDVLAKEASICSIVKMEELSEKFTFDTFMKVAFNYDLEALSDSTEYQKLRENQKIRGKVRGSTCFAVYHVDSLILSISFLKYSIFGFSAYRGYIFC
jgi:hypothetical protein